MSSRQRKRDHQNPGTSQSSQSQSSQGEGSSSSTALSPEEYNNLISDVVQYILVQNHHKHPIKQHDIKKNVLKVHSKQHKDVINEAKNTLSQTFGFRLVEVEPDSSKSYMLVNNLANFTPKEEEEPEYILLFLVLALIFMCGGCVNEDVMWKYLAGIQILNENVQDPFFGDVRKMVTQELVKKLYLKYTRIADSDPVKYEFKWGRRAEEEVSKKVLLQFVGEVFGQSDLSVWTEPYAEATMED